MTIEPAIELFAFPALGEMFAKDRQCTPELWPSQQPGEVVSSLVIVWSVDAPAQLLREESERERISGVHLHLKVRLLPVGSEGTLTDDQSHNVSDLEGRHAVNCNACSRVEQRHVALFGVGRREMSHVAHSKAEELAKGELFVIPASNQ